MAPDTEDMSNNFSNIFWIKQKAKPGTQLFVTNVQWIHMWVVDRSVKCNAKRKCVGMMLFKIQFSVLKSFIAIVVNLSPETTDDLLK